jgi:hypothetical protein
VFPPSVQLQAHNLNLYTQTPIETKLEAVAVLESALPNGPIRVGGSIKPPKIPGYDWSWPPAQPRTPTLETIFSDWNRDLGTTFAVSAPHNPPAKLATAGKVNHNEEKANAGSASVDGLSVSRTSEFQSIMPGFSIYGYAVTYQVRSFPSLLPRNFKSPLQIVESVWAIPCSPRPRVWGRNVLL